jgi:Tfp pilus assembly protein PilF
MEIAGEALKQMSVAEFVRRFKREIQECEDSRFVFFIGAGCSISSSIPGANDLVKMWLRSLKKLRIGDENNYEKWAKEEFIDYDEKNPAKHYGRVIEDLFLNSETRQREIERLTDGKDPGFGYAVLAKLMGHKDFGSHCNAVLTVNFDDLIADALYLYTNKKPLVIVHESLVGFVRSTRKRPLVLKLHGDARLEPKNTESETNELADSVKKVLKNFLAEAGLIFIGYGGHDESIAHILNELPRSALPWGIYWINNEIPETSTGKWLRDRKAIWVKHLDFDELMLLIWKEFELGHPDEMRFTKLIDTYKDTFEKLRNKLDSQPQNEITKELSASLDKALKDAEPNWWGYLLEAKKYEKKDPDRAEKIYEEAIRKFPTNNSILYSFNIFLRYIRKDYDRAEELYKKSIVLNPNDAVLLGSYAIFLNNIKKDYDRADEFYKKSIVLAPNAADLLGNYAGFLLAKGDNTGFDLLQKAVDFDPDGLNKSLNLEILFYKFAHSHDSDSRNLSLSKIKILLKEGARSPGWDFSDNVKKAIDDGHSCSEFLSSLSKVISAEEDIKSLDRFDAWTKEEMC